MCATDKQAQDTTKAYRDAATGDIDAWRAPADVSAARPASGGTKASVTLAAKAQAQTNTQQASFMVMVMVIVSMKMERLFAGVSGRVFLVVET